jgi:hypothetical protein
VYSNRVDDLIKTLSTVYDHTPPRWHTIESLMHTFRWASLVQNTTADYIAPFGISEAFAHEAIEGSARVNYGQVCLLLR